MKFGIKILLIILKRSNTTPISVEDLKLCLFNWPPTCVFNCCLAGFVDVGQFFFFSSHISLRAACVNNLLHALALSTCLLTCHRLRGGHGSLAALHASLAATDCRRLSTAVCGSMLRSRSLS